MQEDLAVRSAARALRRRGRMCGALRAGQLDVGAIVTFTGLCREGSGEQRIEAMTLDHYPAMADEEIARHVSEATTRWPLLGVTVIHRHGRIPIGANIVLVLTASAHRAAAFEAAEFLMDYLKTSAPFWKREEGDHRLGRGQGRGQRGGLALDALMAKKAVKRGKVSAARAKKSPIRAKAATAAQLVRDAARRLKAARVTFAHGTSDAIAEAAFIIAARRSAFSPTDSMNMPEGAPPRGRLRAFVAWSARGSRHANPRRICSTRSTCAPCRSTSMSVPSYRAPTSVKSWTPILVMTRCCSHPAGRARARSLHRLRLSCHPRGTLLSAGACRCG